MFATPQKEHRWLDQLIGDWEFSHHCKMPDGSQSSSPGKMICRSLAGMWLICESSGESQQGTIWSSIMTLGFDAAKGLYVGTFVGSMMTNIWHYSGVLDATGKVLPLDSQGPKFKGSGVGKYRDTIEIIDKDTWKFCSEFLADDGKWFKFLNATHVRVNG